MAIEEKDGRESDRKDVNQRESRWWTCMEHERGLWLEILGALHTLKGPLKKGGAGPLRRCPAQEKGCFLSYLSLRA